MSWKNTSVEYADFNYMCRLCLRRATNPTFIKDLTSSKQFGFIEKVLKTHISLEIEDNKPQNICVDCKMLLFKTCSFLEMCILSNNILDKALMQINITSNWSSDSENALKQNNSEAGTLNHEDGDFLEASQSNIKVETVTDEKDDVHEYIFGPETTYSRKDDSEENHLSEKNTMVKVEDNEIIIKNETSMTELSDKIGVPVEDVTMHINSYAYPCIKTETPENLSNLNLKEHNYNEVTDVNKNSSKRTRKRRSTICFGENQRSVKKRLVAPCINKRILQFNCVICKEILPKFEDVIEHFDKTHEGSSRCILCDRFYSLRAKKVLKYHMNTHRPKGTRFDCLKCCQYFLSKEEMTEHYKSEEHNADPKTCKICNKKFKCKFLTLEHIGSHTNERKHQCPICGKFFRFNGGLTKHIKTVHQGFRLLCSLCGKLYTTKVSLDSHIGSAHKGEKLVNTIQKYSEKRKLFKKQTDTNGTTCRHCDEEFYTVKERKKHESIKHQSSQEYRCPRCLKAFSSSETRTAHIHSVHIKHKCPICGQGFALEDAFDRHVDAHKAGFAKCEVCGLECRSKANLKDHMNIHTDNRPYKCDKCNMSFRQKSHLTYHQFRHTRKKPFECHLCKKAFGQKCHLDSHLSVHTGERPYACDLCDKAYPEKGTLRKHIKKTHEKLGTVTSKTKRFTLDTSQTKIKNNVE